MNYSMDLEKVGRQLFPFYLFLIFWAPIPLGSNRPLAWGFLAACALLLLAIYLWNYSRANLRPPVLTRDAKLIILLMGIWLSFQIIQIVPLPVEFLQRLSPKLIELKVSALGASSVSFMPISFDISASLQNILKTTLYITLFVLTICLVQSRDRVRMLILTIALIGVLQAVWGLSMAFLAQDSVNSSGVQNYDSVVKGTFVNRNHFGGFINLSIAAIAGLLLSAGIREKRRIHRDSRKHHWQSRAMDWRLYLIPYFGIVVTALYFCQSRGAIFAFYVMLIVLLICMLFLKLSIKQIYYNYKWPFWMIIFVALFSSADFISNRLPLLDSDLNTRTDIWVNSFALIKDFWITGIGGGSFQYLYPLYDSGLTDIRLVHAHNDYLEILAEQGVIGLSLFLCIVLLCVKNAVHAIRKFRIIGKSAYAFAALIAIFGFLVHAFVDFNFQVPSNAIYFFVFLAIALLQGMDSVHEEERETVWDEDAFNGAMTPLKDASTMLK